MLLVQGLCNLLTLAIKKLEKAKSITEDDAKKAQEDIQKIVDKYIKEIDIARAEKEKEIMEV